jgi:hypothetical protein
MPIPRPYRVLAVGGGRPDYFAASEDEKRDVFLPTFRRVLARWEELGARVVASFCDDVVQAGPNAAAWYLIFELDDLAVGAEMMIAARELERYVCFELRIGRPFWAREEAVDSIGAP